MINGRDLIAAGMKPGPHMRDALAKANALSADHGALFAIAGVVEEWRAKEASRPPLLKMSDDAKPWTSFTQAGSEAELDNLHAVGEAMRELMKCPTVLHGTYLPDACPAGVIPVGAVVETDNAIHPGFHSSDVCCSVMATMFDESVDPKKLLDAAHAVTHFGGGGRREKVASHTRFDAKFRDNKFLRGLEEEAAYHMGTQGDGNHFLFVGRSRATGQVALVTHHGSRGPGAKLFKRGMAAAAEHTAKIAKGVPRAMSWLDATSREGREYWNALQIVREWTRASHTKIHRMAATLAEASFDALERFWNEHNFVFERDAGRFLHAKGATPAWGQHARDADEQGRVLIPLNMGSPILVAKGLDRPDALGFAPHGAGRNMSRTQFMRENSAEKRESELLGLKERGLDIRSWSGVIDASELPSAYKSAPEIVQQIEAFGLAEIVDQIDPYGSIMAGEWVRR